ncbi:MAG: rod shape-determining protein MreD [Pseudomonadota bacterium]|nr:rod shape-determining protein MreD [Pseudomonadota bacterium]
MESSWSETLLPLGTLIIALLLSILPLPEVIVSFRPDWVAIILVYWSLFRPGYFGFLTAFWLGLALDALYGSLLGQHALALLTVTYIARHFHLRIRVFPIWQMSVTILALLALYEFLLFWADGVAARSVPAVDRWAPVVIGALLWPLVFASMGRLLGAKEREVRNEF